MSMNILRSGMLTTIQDLGRWGYQKYGILVGGAMDTDAARLSNRLVGNDESEGVLEITLIGPVIRFTEDALIALCGADLTPLIDNCPMPMGRPVYVSAGTTLRFGQPKRGCRTYLAVSGGFDIPQVMGSKSTYLQAHLGGYKGRPLQKGDILSLCGLTPAGEKILSHLKPLGNVKTVPWYIMEPSVYHGKPQAIRLTKGLQYDAFATVSQGDLVKKEFTITVQADRMGYRLEGPSLQLKEPQEMISEAAVFGTMQVPGNGNPIILMADHQSVAGYLKIGQICLADLPALAQCGPGTKLHFALITTEEAEKLWRAHERYMDEIILALQCRFS